MIFCENNDFKYFFFEKKSTSFKNIVHENYVKIYFELFVLLNKIIYIINRGSTY